MSTITKEEQLKLMQSNGITILKTIEEIDAIFSIKSLSSNNPIIKTNDDVLIFFDTAEHNNSYISDLLTEYITTYNKLNFSSISKLLKLDNKNLSQEIDFVNDIKSKVITQTSLTKLYFCENEKIYIEIFEEYIKKRFANSNLENKLLPIILTLKGNPSNEKPKDIFIDVETLSPLNYNVIMKNMVMLYDYNKLTL